MGSSLVDGLITWWYHWDVVKVEGSGLLGGSGSFRTCPCAAFCPGHFPYFSFLCFLALVIWNIACIHPSHHDRLVHPFPPWWLASLNLWKEAIHPLNCSRSYWACKLHQGCCLYLSVNRKVHYIFPEELLGICLYVGNQLPNKLSAFWGTWCH